MLDFSKMETQDIFQCTNQEVTSKHTIVTEVTLNDIISENNNQFPLGGEVDPDYEFKITNKHFKWLVEEVLKLEQLKKALRNIS